MRGATALLTILVLALAACSGGESGEQGSGTADAGAGGNGGEGGGEGTELVVAINTLASMDFSPITSEQDNEKWLSLMGNNLVRLNKETGDLEGELLESWEVSEDGLTWDFTLRPDVPFHDDWGTVTSDDVAFTFEQWIHPDSTHSARTIFREVLGENMENFEAVSDLEFRITMTEPQNAFAAALCSCEPGPTIFPREYYEQEGDAALAHPIGTGPWQFVSKTDGQELVLERFEDYWDGAPQVERLILQEIPDGAARLTQVQAGAVHMAELDGSLVGEAEAQGLQIMGIPAARNAFIHLGGSYWTDPEHLDADAPWIQADEPEKGKLIREAMSLAIDRQAMLDQALGGHGVLSYGPVVANPLNPELVDPSWELPEYDLELARQKLAEGGYPDGFDVTVMLYGDDFDTVAMGEMLAGMWEELGLNVTREPIDDEIVDNRENSYETHGLAWVTTVSLAPEAARPLYSYTTKTPEEGSMKFFHESIDTAYEQLLAEPDASERRRIVREMTTVLRDEYIALTLMAGEMLYVARPEVSGWEPMPTTNFPNGFETVTLG